MRFSEHYQTPCSMTLRFMGNNYSDTVVLNYLPLHLIDVPVLINTTNRYQRISFVSKLLVKVMPLKFECFHIFTEAAQS